MNEFFFLFSAIVFLALNTAVPAETIVLKNGREIVAEIKRETEEAVIVSKQDGSFVYSISKDRIESIRESTPEELKLYNPTHSASSATPTVRPDEKQKARREELDRYRLERYEKQVEAAKRSRGRIKVKFAEGRFGVVDALLNDKVNASLYVDTGASTVLISSDVARKLGIDLKEIKEKVTVVLADGRTSSATPVTLRSVEVGSSKIRNVEAAVSESSPGGGIDGLLGMSFLRYFHVKVDSKENCLVLERY